MLNDLTLGIKKQLVEMARRSMILLSFFVFLQCAKIVICDNPVVETNVGSIRGLRASDGNYSMFMGIPYATIEETNPFGPSVPYPKFETTFDAYDDTAICPQIEEFNHTIVGDLDCLHLNIYVPDSANTNNRLPILVWIFGGGFQLGFAGRFLYGPRFLVRHDIIFITLNYRLGPYGFMCLDTPNIPGNQGLKDQRSALKWIKDNIGAFGGDPNKITVAGNSAGAMSVDLHLYFGNEDLFQQVILESGVALFAGTVMQSDPSAPLKLVEHIGFSTNDVNEALSFLAQVDSDIVIAAANQIDINFLPCVEKNFQNVDTFITEYPVNYPILEVKDMPILMGFNNDEMMTGFAQFPDSAFSEFDFVKILIDAVFDFDAETQDESSKIVRHFYLGDRTIDVELKQEITDMSSDFYFIHPILRSMLKYLRSGADTIFLYQFSYDGGRNFAKHRLNVTGGGAAHADELGYLFDITYMNQNLTPEDQLIVDRITALWANFVKYSDPTPEITELLPIKWYQITEEIWNYLNIDLDLSAGSRPLHKRMAFLDLFYKMNEEYQIGYNNRSTGSNFCLGISLPLLLIIQYLL